MINTEFEKHLKKPAALNLLLQMIPIPMSIFSAILTSKVVASAVEGSVQAVLRYALLLLAVIILQRGLSRWLEISLGKMLSQALHKCKILLYKAFLSQPQHVLYASRPATVWNDSMTISSQNPYHSTSQNNRYRKMVVYILR